MPRGKNCIDRNAVAYRKGEKDDLEAKGYVFTSCPEGHWHLDIRATNRRKTIEGRN